MALSKAQYEELKQIIEDRCVALGEEIQAGALRVRNDSHAATTGGLDSADVAATGQIVDIDNAELARDLKELRELEAARARIDAGRYAQCIDCQEEIEYPRLRAQPMAARCLHCQELFENTHAHASAPKL